MLEPRRHPGLDERERLVLCFRDLHTARARLRAARHEGVRSRDKQPLRAQLLAALEGYAVAITMLGAPLPRRLVAEIELYRRLRNRV
jgi:hypothetical protein